MESNELYVSQKGDSVLFQFENEDQASLLFEAFTDGWIVNPEKQDAISKAVNVLMSHAEIESVNTQIK